MRRRDFVAVLAGAATAWPLPLSAQKNEVRRIAVLMGIAPTEQSQAYVAAFWRRLEELGWTKDRNIRTALVDTRTGTESRDGSGLAYIFPRRHPCVQ
jgi:hypothetical protein